MGSTNGWTMRLAGGSAIVAGAGDARELVNIATASAVVIASAVHDERGPRRRPFPLTGNLISSSPKRVVMLRG
jgi:hypothetical protein